MIRASIFLLTFILFGCHSRQDEKTRPSSSPVLENSKSDKEIVCFVYHRFGDERFPSTNTSIEDFKMHLAWLADHEYQVLSLSNAIDYLSNDTPPKKTAVITIDDGYKSFYKNGLPLLHQYQFPATLFINTETIEGDDYMNWRELKYATTQKIEIGNHTHTHAYFLNQESSLRYTNFENEMLLAQRLIKKNLGIIPNVFAYPYGEFDQKMKTILQSNGFIGGAAQNSGVMNNSMDQYQIPRFPMSEDYAKMFEEKASMRALNVTKKIPEANLMPPDTNKPLLTLTINTEGLVIDQLQCFVQGGACKLKVIDSNTHQMKLTLQSTHPLTARRRTLYTLTVPDSTGNWYWFSHLWVNNFVK